MYFHEQDMSTVIWEPTTAELKAIYQHLLSISNEEELKKLTNGFEPLPRGQLRLHSDSHSFQEEHSDEELEHWARTVDLPGFDDNVSPFNALTVLLRFIIGEV